MTHIDRALSVCYDPIASYTSMERSISGSMHDSSGGGSMLSSSLGGTGAETPLPCANEDQTSASSADVLVKLKQFIKSQYLSDQGNKYAIALGQSQYGYGREKLWLIMRLRLIVPLDEAFHKEN